MLITFSDKLFNTPIVVPLGCLTGSITYIMIKDIIKFQIFNIPCKPIHKMSIKEFNNFGLYFGGLIGITRVYCGMPIFLYYNNVF